jgi:hypothetical protein
MDSSPDRIAGLCFSNYLRLDPTRSDGFIRAAQALLDGGASANTGFWDITHEPEPEWESAIYGAAGVAHHAELTRLLLEYGANPNDAVQLLVERGAPVDVPDGKGRTPLASPFARASIRTGLGVAHPSRCVCVLLKAGASVRGITFPSGYAAVDDLLKTHGAGSWLPQPD